MNKEEFVGIVERIIQSLRDKPDQFHVNINIVATGLKVESSGMSTGVSSTVYGGTGISAKAEGGKQDVTLTQGIADQEFRKKLGKSIESLEKIVMEAKKDKPDKKRLQSLIDELKPYGPAIVEAVLSKLLDLLVGK
jgi:hypothetical protein